MRTWRRTAGLTSCLAMSIAAVGVGCASTSAPRGVEGPPPVGSQPPCPEYDGERRKVQVLELRIPAADIERYPELADKRVGFGLSKVLVESLFDTGRFRFLEDKAEILKRLVDQWELTEDGILVRDPGPEVKLQAPEFLVYAEIFDFVACAASEELRGPTKELTCDTSVGVQVRIANTATGEYVPGSSDSRSPASRYAHSRALPLFARDRNAFDQSAVGKATRLGIDYAVCQVLARFDDDGW